YRGLAETQIGLSVTLQQSPARFADAEALHDRATAQFERLVGGDPADADSLCGLAMLRLNRAYMLADQGEVDAALVDLAKNVPPLEALLAREPHDVVARDR